MSMVEKETKVVNENKMMVNMTKEALYDLVLMLLFVVCLLFFFP